MSDSWDSFDEDLRVDAVKKTKLTPKPTYSDDSFDEDLKPMLSQKTGTATIAVDESEYDSFDDDLRGDKMPMKGEPTKVEPITKCSTISDDSFDDDLWNKKPLQSAVINESEQLTTQPVQERTSVAGDDNERDSIEDDFHYETPLSVANENPANAYVRMPVPSSWECDYSPDSHSNEMHVDEVSTVKTDDGCVVDERLTKSQASHQSVTTAHDPKSFHDDDEKEPESDKGDSAKPINDPPKRGFSWCQLRDLNGLPASLFAVRYNGADDAECNCPLSGVPTTCPFGWDLAQLNVPPTTNDTLMIPHKGDWRVVRVDGMFPHGMRYQLINGGTVLAKKHYFRCKNRLNPNHYRQIQSTTM